MSDFYGGSNLVFEYNGGLITGGGYSIQSETFNNMIGGGGETKLDKNKDKDKDKEHHGSDSLIIPIGLINLNCKGKSPFNMVNSTDILSHDLYDNLLNLISVNPKNISRKNNKSNKSKTIKKRA